MTRLRWRVCRVEIAVGEHEDWPTGRFSTFTVGGRKRGVLIRLGRWWRGFLLYEVDENGTVV